jgi:hypothetical protein
MLSCTSCTIANKYIATKDKTEQVKQTQEAEKKADETLYKNADYSFTFKLPESWKGYKIVAGNWEGMFLNDSANKTKETGPIIYIRHPAWTSEKQRQDIPIMIFTKEQWSYIEKEQMSVGAAPITPSTLGQNSKYVFALPARYNYAFPEGYQEVEEILKNKPLSAYEK